MAQIFEGLLTFKEGSLEIEPQLAEHYSVSEDGLTYRFHIRKGVHFHDGRALDAEAAAFSFRRQMDPSHPAHFPSSGFQYWRLLFNEVASIEVEGTHTLTFHLSSPNTAILYAFASFPGWLISPGALDAYGERMPFHPVGTGPYRFSSWHANEAVVLERNTDYWGEQKPGFDRLIIRSIPLNSARIAELRAGSIDGLDGIQGAELKELEDDPRFIVHHGPGQNVGYMAISEKAVLLRDPDIRRAIAMAIDREALVRLALDGYGSVAHYPIPTGFSGELEGDPPITYNPDAARTILKNHPALRDNTLRLSTFNQPRMYFPDPGRVASLIRSDLEAIGLRVEIINRDFSSHLHRVRQGEFDLALLGWIADTPDSDNFLSTFFHSRSAEIGSATNISLYKNEEMDTFLDRAARAPSIEARAQLHREAIRVWARDLPLIPLVHGEHIVVLKSDIDGYTLHPNGQHFFGRARRQSPSSHAPSD